MDKGGIRTSEAEIEQYLGILLRTCIVKMLQYQMYWHVTSRYELLAHLMSRDRFETLKKYLHSTPPNVQDESKDRLFKIRPLFELSRKNCVKQIPEDHNSTDEQIVPFKGKSFLRRYMSNKPLKWGCKVFSCNGSSGQVYDFDLEGAPDPMSPKISKKLGIMVLIFS